MHQQRLRALLMTLAGAALGMALCVATSPAAQPQPLYVFDPRVMSAEPALPVLPLAEIVRGAATDADAGARIAAYFDANRESLAQMFNEPNEARLRALFGMYIVHVAVPYNVVDVYPASLIDFISAPAAHCGVYAQAQGQVYNALGLRWRRIHVDDGWHGLIEVRIDGQFEVFDSTANVWVNQSVARLLDGTARDYRAFYTPIEDRAAADSYRAHLSAGYNVPALRSGLPLWGVRVFPSKWEIAQ